MGKDKLESCGMTFFFFAPVFWLCVKCVQPYLKKRFHLLKILYRKGIETQYDVVIIAAIRNHVFAKWLVL